MTESDAALGRRVQRAPKRVIALSRCAFGIDGLTIRCLNLLLFRVKSRRHGHVDLNRAARPGGDDRFAQKRAN
jgi:hypothetical protein